MHPQIITSCHHGIKLLTQLPTLHLRQSVNPVSQVYLPKSRQWRKRHSARLAFSPALPLRSSTVSKAHPMLCMQQSPLLCKGSQHETFSLHSKVLLCTPIMSFGVLLPGRTPWVTAFQIQPQSASTSTGSAKPSAAGNT